jgi:signal transduction histidine kinase
VGSITVPPSSAPFPEREGQQHRQLLRLAAELADAKTRPAAARAYAASVGAHDLLVFIRDHEAGLLLPAPGFPQTLPHGERWRQFLEQCVAAGRHAWELPFPAATTVVPAVGIACRDEAVLVFLGGAPIPDGLEQARLVLPLLAAALRGERATSVASAQMELARRATDESRMLTQALDAARRELQRALNDAEDQRAGSRRQASELEAILEAIPDAVYVCNTEGQVVRANARASALFSLDQPGSRETPLLYDRPRPPGLDAGETTPIRHGPVARALAGQNSRDYRYVLRRASSLDDIHLVVNSAPIRGWAGEVIGAVAVATDITQLTRLERQKDEFLSIASHELRTPLTTLKALAQMVARAVQAGRPVDPRAATRMNGAIQRVERLVSDLVDATRIESGRLPYHIERCNLSALCRQVAEDITEGIEHQITLELPAEPVELELDCDRIGQVLTNLLTNAFKYAGPEKPLLLRLLRGEDCIQVEVADRGPGIPPAALPHLFERFYRVSEIGVQSGSHIGLGLGLYIARSIVERHGGQIGVRSEPGTGSTFWFTLPLVPASRE